MDDKKIKVPGLVVSATPYIYINEALYEVRVSVGGLILWEDPACAGQRLPVIFGAHAEEQAKALVINMRMAKHAVKDAEERLCKAIAVHQGIMEFDAKRRRGES